MFPAVLNTSLTLPLTSDVSMAKQR